MWNYLIISRIKINNGDNMNINMLDSVRINNL